MIERDRDRIYAGWRGEVVKRVERVAQWVCPIEICYIIIILYTTNYKLFLSQWRSPLTLLQSSDVGIESLLRNGYQFELGRTCECHETKDNDDHYSQVLLVELLMRRLVWNSGKLKPRAVDYGYPTTSYIIPSASHSNNGLASSYPRHVQRACQFTSHRFTGLLHSSLPD